MSQSHVGENNPNARMDVDTSTTNNPPTQTNPTGTTAPSEAKKRKVMSLRSFVWDHYIKWDQETDEMREEGDGPLFEDECRCRYCRKKYCCNTKKNGTSSLKNHINNCNENPHNKDTRQSQISLQPTREDCRVGTLSTWKYDEKAVRLALSKMLILDELPFKFVEGVGFRLFMSILCPKFVIPSRWTIGRDIYQLYLDKKIALKKYINTTSHYVCLTTDTWTSIQKINYMCLTVHWIGIDWNLHKRILNFCPITSHRGEVLRTALESCLHDWGIKKVLTITVDNASSNDKMIQYLKRKIINWNDKHGTFLGGEYLHICCVAHITNLVVQDGLKENIGPISRVRCAIKYVKQSPSRWAKWKACVEKEKIAIETGMCLDVQTRWNSTFLMLQAAKKCQSDFLQFELEDPTFRGELESTDDGNGRIPDEDDWECVGRLCRFLQILYDLTLKVSGTLYVTSNVFLHQITNVEGELYEAMVGDDELACDMACKMKVKYEKYWGNCEKVNLLMFIPCILDPRFKLDFTQYVIKEMFKSQGDKGQAMPSKLERTLNSLYNEYKAIHNKENGIRDDVQVSASQSLSTRETGAAKRFHMMAKFNAQSSSSSNVTSNQSELDKYLNEAKEPLIDGEDPSQFNILEFWKVNSGRFPILSRMARDVLVIPIPTVASESAFSTGGRVLDPFRSSLSTRSVQCLICTQDWLRGQLRVPMVSIEEDLADVEKFDKDLDLIGMESTITEL